MIPRYYTEEEGGSWQVWPFPDECAPTWMQLCSYKCYNLYPVPDEGLGYGLFLNIRLPKGKKIKQFVHSIKFSNGDEWDCINGFRNYRTSGTISELRKALEENADFLGYPPHSRSVKRYKEFMNVHTA